MHDLTKSEIFGKYDGHLCVVEFQKRGLPHAHILIILADGRKTLLAEEVDKLTLAELPPSPNETGITEDEGEMLATMGCGCH